MTMPAYRRRAADVLKAAEIVLRDLGLTRLYLSADAAAGVGVLSVARGVTAWCDGRTVNWRHQGAETRWTAADAEGAARELAKLVGIEP
ncbi:MAG: hypothetical protein ACRDNF_15295 [Streptosporangiaceae bacterium]